MSRPPSLNKLSHKKEVVLMDFSNSTRPVASPRGFNL
jgi:hypothetical protein